MKLTPAQQKMIERIKADGHIVGSEEPGRMGLFYTDGTSVDVRTFRSLTSKGLLTSTDADDITTHWSAS